MKQELFSERIKNYRLAWNLSQEQLGDALGVSARYVGMLENGTKEVEDEKSAALLDELKSLLVLAEKTGRASYIRSAQEVVSELTKLLNPTE